jgi:predicted phage-related endonuclease
MAESNIAYIVPGLSPEQHKARKARIGGSDINRIMRALTRGDPADVQRFIAEKRGDIAPKPLNPRQKFRANLGQVTEAYNLHYLSEISGLVITDMGQSRQHEEYYWMGNTLDGMTVLDNGHKSIVQAKHTAEFVERGDRILRVTLEDRAESYMAQLQHEMIVCDTQWAVLSVIFGNAYLQWVAIPRDPLYCLDLISLEREIWDCVETGKPWRDTPPPASPELPAAIRKAKPYSMQGNNEWAISAHGWLENRTAVKKFKDAEASLKKLADDASKESFGHGVRVTVSSDGKRTVKEHAESLNAPVPEPADEIPHFDDWVTNHHDLSC